VADHKLATGQLDSLSGKLYVWLELNGPQLSPVTRELLQLAFTTSTFVSLVRAGGWLVCRVEEQTGPCYSEVRSDRCHGQLTGVVCSRRLCCATIGRAWGIPCEECPRQLTQPCQRGFIYNSKDNKCVGLSVRLSVCLSQLYIVVSVIVDTC